MSLVKPVDAERLPFPLLDENDGGGDVADTTKSPPSLRSSLEPPSWLSGGQPASLVSGLEPADQVDACGPRPNHHRSIFGTIVHGLGSAVGHVAGVVTAAPGVVINIVEAVPRDIVHPKDATKDILGPVYGMLEIGGLRWPVGQRASWVKDGVLMRGSQPDRDMWWEFGQRLQHECENPALKGIALHGIVNLQAENLGEGDKAKQAGMHYLHLSIVDSMAPSQDQMLDFLDFVTNPENQPVYVHCHAGLGRTGVAVACYRMAVDGWTLAQALAEANGIEGAPGENKHHLSPRQEEFLRDFDADLTAGNFRQRGYSRTPAP